MFFYFLVRAVFQVAFKATYFQIIMSEKYTHTALHHYSPIKEVTKLFIFSKIMFRIESEIDNKKKRNAVSNSTHTETK